VLGLGSLWRTSSERGSKAVGRTSQSLPPPSTHSNIMWRQEDVCILMDHELVEADRCQEMLRPNALKDLIASAKRYSPSKIQDSLQTLITCINRGYACQFGHRFIHTASPKLAVWPHDGARGGRLDDVEQDLQSLSGTCRAAGATLGKGGQQPKHLPINRLVPIPPSNDDAILPRWCGSPLQNGTRLARSIKWCKVVQLAEVLTRFPSCSIVAFVDSDVYLKSTRSLLHNQKIKDWLDDPTQSFFAAQEPHGPKDIWLPGSYMDSFGRNNLTNTIISTAFMLVKRNPNTLAMLAKWWCSVDEKCQKLSTIKTQWTNGCYRTDWSHEQRMMSDMFFSNRVDPLATVLAPGMRHATRVNDFNTPSGEDAVHIWFKDDPKYLKSVARFALGRLSLIKCTNQTSAQKVHRAAQPGQVHTSSGRNPHTAHVQADVSNTTGIACQCTWASDKACKSRRNGNSRCWRICCKK